MDIKNILFEVKEEKPWYQQNKNQKWIFFAAMTITFIIHLI